MGINVKPALAALSLPLPALHTPIKTHHPPWVALVGPRDARDGNPPSKLHRTALNPIPTKTQEPDQLRRSKNHRPRPRGDDSGCVGGGVDKSGDRRDDGRPNRGLEHPSGPPRERGRRRGLRRVGDSRPGRESPTRRSPRRRPRSRGGPEGCSSPLFGRPSPRRSPLLSTPPPTQPLSSPRGLGR